MAFNRVTFDRNSFDRAVGSNRFEVGILSYSSVKLAITMQTPVPLSLLEGTGGLQIGLVMKQDIGLTLSGTSGVAEVEPVLRMDMRSTLSGSSSSALVPVVKTPIAGVIKSTSKAGTDKRMFLYQTMNSALKSSGDVDLDMLMKTDLHEFELSGSGDIDNKIALWLPLSLKIHGQGQMMLKRLGALNESAIELLGIDLEPGGSVTIDTDLLQVLIGAKEDVSSVTTDSVFFELNPGENELTIQTDTGEDLEIVAIWQNRWL